MSAAIKTARARETGRLVEVWRAEDLGVEDDGGDWVTVCVEHGTSIHHETRKLALEFSSVPLEWCEVCNGQEEWSGPTEFFASRDYGIRCQHGVLVWVGHECGECMDFGIFTTYDHTRVSEPWKVPYRELVIEPTRSAS